MPDQSPLSLAALVNGEETLLYDRSIELPAKQKDYLQQLDLQMNKGFDYQGEFINTPEIVACARLVASELIDALFVDNTAKSSACCAWLATRLPDLRQVKSRYSQEELKIELVFDKGIEQSRQEQVISFHTSARESM